VEEEEGGKENGKENGGTQTRDNIATHNGLKGTKM
jgi:hypothetical protein